MLGLFCRQSVKQWRPCTYVSVRGKKQVQKMKSKKEIQKEMMKDYVKRMELEELKRSAALKAASKGDPMDPEMFNPARKRECVVVSREEAERRYLLAKSWSRYSMAKHKEDLGYLQSAVQCRQKALRELKKLSHHLYIQALQLNPQLFPFERQGPTATPPTPGYEPPEVADT